MTGFIRQGSASGRVIRNTGIVYTRMLLTVGVSLYSSRLVLEALGVNDYGIYNLVAGVIAMLSFLNGAMTISTQRYFSFYLGKGDPVMQRKIFNNSLLLHIVVGAAILLLLLALGQVLFRHFFNISVDRIDVARKVYILSSVAVFFSMIAVPFSASLNAHENMLWIAVVSILDVMLKLAIALSLGGVTFDRLLYYAIFVSIAGVLSFALYAGYCFVVYEECRWKIFSDINSTLLKELLSFTGWNLFGAACAVGRTQGLAVLLNMFFGTAVNAAYGIANQVSAQLSFFSTSLLQALNPQIMQSEGMGNRERMLRLSFTASKFGFFLLAFIAIPCIFEMPALLNLWLKEVPVYTVIFCRLVLLVTLVNQLTIGLQAALQATGKVKTYQLVVGSVIMLNLPVAYISLKTGLPPYFVLVTSVAIELIACIMRLYFMRIITRLSVGEYFRKVILKEMFPLLSVCSVGYLITSMSDGDYRFLLTISLSTLVFGVAIYFTGLNSDEKAIVWQVVGKGKKWIIN